jgi:hypothetical protein
MKVSTVISDHLPSVHMFNTNIFSKNTTKNVSNLTYQRTCNKINTEVFENVIGNPSF